MDMEQQEIVSEKRKYTIAVLNENWLGDLDEDAQESLVEMRGGCSCWQIQAPCDNCTNPITEDEAEELGILADEPDDPNAAMLERDVAGIIEKPALHVCTPRDPIHPLLIMADMNCRQQRMKWGA